MVRINLRDYYPFYTSDCYIDVPGKVAALLLANLENRIMAKRTQTASSGIQGAKRRARHDVSGARKK